ncbi:MAG: hypothetical protein WC763_06015 [Candidatus Paceibacterota bacterium]|jgi:hypothetical protein
MACSHSYLPSALVALDGEDVSVWREQRLPLKGNDEPSIVDGVTPASLRLFFVHTPLETQKKCVIETMDNGIRFFFDQTTKKLRMLEIPEPLLCCHLSDNDIAEGEEEEEKRMNNNGKKHMSIEPSYFPSLDVLYIRLCRDMIIAPTLSYEEDRVLFDLNADKLILGVEFPSVKSILHTN